MTDDQITRLVHRNPAVAVQMYRALQAIATFDRADFPTLVPTQVQEIKALRLIAQQALEVVESR